MICTSNIIYTSILAGIFFASIFISTPGNTSELHFYVGAGLRQPTEKLVEIYSKRSGNKIYMDFGGAGTLMSRINISGKGDLFMPGSYFYIEKLKNEGKIITEKNIMSHTPVVAVNRNTGDLIREFYDLKNPGTRIALGDPEAMAFGKTADSILTKTGIRDETLKNVVVFGATVKQLALYVANGDVDASIIGRADAFQYKDQVRIVKIPEAFLLSEIISIVLLDSTTDKKAAMDFIDFMGSEEAADIFEAYGFLPLSSSTAKF